MTLKTTVEKGDKVVCVDDSDGTMLPVKAYTKEVKETKLVKDKKSGKKKPVRTGKITKVKVPAVLAKGKTYKVTGVSRPPHDHPDRPLIQVELPSPHEECWWAAWRFQKKGK